MAAIDDRVVKMEFNNSAFQRGAQITLSTLDKLKNALNFTAKDPLKGVQDSASHFSMRGVGSAVDSIKAKFSTLGLVGVAVLANLATRAVTAGLSMVKSLTLQPILDGFHEYETQLNSVQTILANTQASGASLGDVNNALNQLNHYADKTIYNFSEMARNIGTFTAAGVDLNTSVQSIKGIANLAALSGSNSQQASTAMYQLSQAISAGRVGLQDWNSVVNAGMGGTVFQRALAQTAVAMGTINKGALKLEGPMKNVKINGESFRQSMTAAPGKTSWLTSDVLTSTLKQFTGDMTDAQLASMGFNKTQIKSIQLQAKTAQQAATKVKTFTQLMGTIKEAVGSGWTQSFQLILGNFNQAKKMWTDASNVLGKMVQHSARARNQMLKDWAKAGGRTALIDAVSNAFHALLSVVKPIKDAFHDVFPPMTGQRLADLTKKVRDFFANLKMGPETADNLKRTFRGFFALLDIGKQIIVGIFHMFGTLFQSISGGSGGILNFTGNIGDMIVKLDEAMKHGDLLKNFFGTLGHILSIPIKLFQAIHSALSGLFSGFDPSKITDGISGVTNRFGDLAGATDKIKSFFTTIGQAIAPGVHAIEQAFSGIATAIGNAFQSGNFNHVFDLINTGLLGGIALMIRKFFSGGMHLDIGNGFLSKLGGVFGGLTDHLHAMTNEVKSNTLLKIAAAVGILAASAVALAGVPSKRLSSAMGSLAMGFGELLGSMKILTTMTGVKGFLKIPIIAASLDMLAGAVLLLVLAVRSLAKLNMNQLQKGLTAVGALLAGISAASIPLSRNSAGLIRAGVGITAIAVAVNLLYLAVKHFASLSWSDMLRGLAGVTGSLVAIAAASRAMPKSMFTMGAGLLVVSAALLAIYKAVSGFASMSWGQLLHGLAGIGGALGVIAVAMRAMPKRMVLQAAALLVLAQALGKIDDAVAKMARLSWSDLAHGLAGLGGALAELVIALNLMDGAVTGALALFIVSKGLGALANVVISFAAMSWGDLLKGLVGLGATLAIIGVAGLLIGPVIPALLGLGAAMILVGGGFALFGLGAMGVAKALGILATSGSAGIKVLMDALEGFIQKLPELGKNLALGLVNFVEVIGQHAPTIINSFVHMLGQLLDAVPKLMPKLVTAFTAIIQGILDVIEKNFPRIVKVGIGMLMSLLEGIRKNIVKITKVVIDIIVRFINTVANNMGRIIEAGVNLLTKFLVGVAKAIGHIPGIVLKVIGAFLGALFGDFPKIIEGGFKLLLKLIEGIVKGIGHLAAAAWKIVSGIVTGIGSLAWRLVKAGGQLLWHILTGIGNAIKSAASWLWNKAKELASNLIEGLKEGITSGTSSIMNAISNMSGGMVNGIESIFGINSPSRVMREIGHHIMNGLHQGLTDMQDKVVGKSGDIAHGTIAAMTKTIHGLSDAMAADPNFTPTITPVLDLSQVRKDASQLHGLVGTSPISANLSYRNASDISATQRAAVEAQPTETTTTAGGTVQFIQNNTSPAALSTVDIYRNTKNQLAQAKKALGVPTR